MEEASVRKSFSWKSVSIYLTIILFLVLIIQFSDSSKRGDREADYLVAIESSYNELLNFQQSILDGKIEVDADKEVIKMSEKNLQTQLGTFIDFFGDQKVAKKLFRRLLIRFCICYRRKAV